MTDPRASTALGNLDLTDPPDSAWNWATVAVDPVGRVRLPATTRTALGAHGGATPVVVLARGDTLLLRPTPAQGRLRTVDGRGRLYVPRWLRAHVTLVVGTRTVDRIALLAPAGLLDPLGDRLLGGQL